MNVPSIGRVGLIGRRSRRHDARFRPATTTRPRSSTDLHARRRAVTSPRSRHVRAHPRGRRPVLRPRSLLAGASSVLDATRAPRARDRTRAPPRDQTLRFVLDFPSPPIPSPPLPAAAIPSRRIPSHLTPTSPLPYSPPSHRRLRAAAAVPRPSRRAREESPARTASRTSRQTSSSSRTATPRS